MQEQRTEPRRRILMGGTISCNYGVGIDCLIRNLSGHGACLEIESPAGVPNVFTLKRKDDKHRVCSVAWRLGRRIGVAFAR